ncbi:hypothetical protein CVT26_004925, partial [Gymnopilus dilepis]
KRFKTKSITARDRRSVPRIGSCRQYASGPGKEFPIRASSPTHLPAAAILCDLLDILLIMREAYLSLAGNGYDFYRAHAATADPYYFDHAWNRVREYGGAPAGGMGVGLNEARHWHRRAYGAMVDDLSIFPFYLSLLFAQNEVHLLAPEELGHAAAYEAYRTWIHNSQIYEPLSGDIERQREALTALAVAEATRLLQFSSRPMDQLARLAATEAAAHTASYIFYQVGRFMTLQFT